MQSPVQAATNSLVKQIATAFFKEISSTCAPADFAVKFWDGTSLSLASAPQFTIVVRQPDALQALLDSPNELTLGEAFVSGGLDIEGDMEQALRFAEQLMSYKPREGRQTLLRKLGSVLSGAGRAGGRRSEGIPGELHSRERDRAAIARHYDVSNEFYALWLDRNLQYTAAYFESTEEDLDAAQTRKLDSICHKLNLQPGDKLLDIGCGWGGLLIYAALHYGVEARGITLSMSQAELARERIRRAGLEGRCDVQICDYRDADGAYDKISSIGMIEHVGRSNLELYFADAWRLLRSGGLFLNSGISSSAKWERQGQSFIDHYVFPDGDLVPLHVTLRAAEVSGFEVRDVDCLREHYALTLDRWVNRLEERAGEAQRATDEATYRTWKLYMAASAHAFRTRRINVYQMLLSKSEDGRCELPLTRGNWLQSTPQAELQH